ncbi:MAG: hypothetical protein HC927_08825 [Deltaproteobacteria bacterium]|nr:hypothetical protein [Deltaproteobacteria bacterium]
MSTANKLNGYTEIIAVTQNAINSQLALLCPRDNSGPIYTQWSIMDPNDPHQWQGLVVTAMAPPTISVVQPDDTFVAQELAMTLNLTSGTLQYYSYGEQASTPISNWKITFRVSLAAITLTGTADLDQISTTSGVSQQLGQYLDSGNFTVAALYTYFEDANIANAVVSVTGPSLTPAQQTTLLTWLAAYLTGLQSSGTPYILGYPIQSTNPVGTLPALPTFAPVSCEFSDTPNPWNYASGPAPSTIGLSTINYLMMTEGVTPPTSSSRFSFDFNWVNDNQFQGVFAIQNDLFRTGYVYNLVLPILRASLGVPDSTQWVCSTNGSGEYTYTLTYTTYPYADQNGGKGKIVGQDWPDNIYEELVETTYCQVTLSKGTQVVLNGTGYFYARGDLYEYPLGIKMHDGWFTSQLDYSFSVALNAGQDGTIQAAFNYTPQPVSTDQWENILFKAYDWLVGWFADTLTDMENDQNSKLTSSMQSASSNLQTQTTAALGQLSTTILLPNGDVFFYKNMSYDDQMNVLMNVSYLN